MTVHIQFRISDEEFERLRKIAAARKVKGADLIKGVVVGFLNLTENQPVEELPNKAPDIGCATCLHYYYRNRDAEEIARLENCRKEGHFLVPLSS